MSSVPGPPQVPAQPSVGYPAVRQVHSGQPGLTWPLGPSGGGDGTGAPSALVGCRPATPGRRTASAVIEGLASGLPVGAASVSLQLGLIKETPALVVVGAVLALGWLAGLVFVALGFSRTGVSPGKKAMGLRLVDARTGGAPGPAAWGRYLLAGLGAAVLVGWVIAVVQILSNAGGKRRAWYDTTTNLVLLDVASGRDPFTEQRAPGVARPGTPAMLPPGGAGAGGTWTGGPLSSGQHGTQFGPGGPGGYTPPVEPLTEVPGFTTHNVPPTQAGPPVPAVQHPSAPMITKVPPASSVPPVPPVQPAPPVPATPAITLTAAPVPAPPTDAAPTPLAHPTDPVHPVGPVPPVDRDLTPPPAPAPAPARATFTFDSGEVHEVAGTGRIGRAPRPPRTGEAPVVVDPSILAIADVTRTVSKSHLSYLVTGLGVHVTDLGSTNGSTVIGPDGDEVTLVAGTAALVAYGSTVTVGEQSFTITRAAAQERLADEALVADGL